MNTPRRHGFTLIELLATLTILAVFSLLATRMTIAAYNLTVSTTRTTASLNQLDSALGQLRRDVWNAQRLAVADPRHLVLQPPGADPITWSLTDSTTLRRDAGNSPRTWTNLPPEISFELAGLVLLIHAPDPDRPGRQATRALPSQLSLAQGATP